MTATNHPKRPAGVDVKPRHVQFDLKDLDHYWHGGDPFKTHFFNGLSTLFPQGERFFIDSVRAVMDKVEDPTLKEEVKGFIAQEAIHGHEHDKYNQMLQDQGFDIAKLERHQDWWTKLGHKTMTKNQQLATTCAVEHFTAIMANAIMEDPERWIGGAPEAMQAMWHWHAIEETEHKAVCFDVYNEVGGSYIVRNLMMMQTTIHFSYMIARHVCHFLAKDKVLWKWQTWKTGYQFLLGKRGIIRQVFKDYLDYYRPGFHPWQQDNSRLVDGWKEKYDDRFLRKSKGQELAAAS
ncbi:metal-dependent hydrolase [Parendozoicomonas haliclonae]|uniref:Putative metal-dependent hydrolase n=1 Tax=Parendozoicomonas haliclonae TaxID=1960125 RepID=A0A1X7AGK8_9GAMM|nr:metal-dependent hydrolase [Parendozoicomonas haliclonae]SMA40249.1 putative metal-dependent hydrolase [Parendozoicomonas haliclonae]